LSKPRTPAYARPAAQDQAAALQQAQAEELESLRQEAAEQLAEHVAAADRVRGLCSLASHLVPALPRAGSW
jgi:LAS superfamily LD-carboxypeptidase LdcB